MALSTKTIKNRIRSIGNTKKITKAMEMVSAAKMRKAVNAVLASREYANTAWQTVLDLATKVDTSEHILLQPRDPIKKSAIILLSANKGLCGGFNSHVIQQALEFSRRQNTAGITDIAWLVMGKKGAEAIAHQELTVVADFEKPDTLVSAKDVLGLAKLAIDGFAAGTYDSVSVIYTDFISPLRQEPRIKQILPITATPDQNLGVVFAHGPQAAQLATSSQPTADRSEFIFEPSAGEVLNQFLPRLIEIQLYQALLESIASEHSARMVAMKNAKEAASDMIDELTLIFNQARQASITREIAEISGGKAAIENA